MTMRGESGTVEDVVAVLAQVERNRRPPRFEPHPLLGALRKAGTAHVYADTADLEEITTILGPDGDLLPAELDGNTANQPLVAKVAERYVDETDPREWADAIAAAAPAVTPEDRMPLMYAILCARTANDVRQLFPTDHRWETSLQLHMDLGPRPEAARRIALLLHRMAPEALVKVPFTPEEPGCLLVARDLEQSGVPVNLTSTFSARQVVTVAALTGASRTNVFLGRLDGGLDAGGLGEYVVARAQLALHDRRREDGVGTRLIAASMREAATFTRLAGVDVFTAPPGVLGDFLREQQDAGPDDIVPRVEETGARRPDVPGRVLDVVGLDGLASLDRVEPELVEFLGEYRRSDEFADLDVNDGDRLLRRFEEAGFGDLFHVPTEAERREARRGKLPELDGRLAGRIPLDTHYSLLACADFAKHQEEIDALVASHLPD